MSKTYYQAAVIDTVNLEQLDAICNVLVSYSVDHEVKFYDKTVAVYIWIYEADYTKIRAAVNSVLVSK